MFYIFLFHQVERVATHNQILCDSVKDFFQVYNTEAKIIGSAKEVAGSIADLVTEITVNSNPDSVAVKQLLVRRFFYFYEDVQIFLNIY